jgi:hypothetical protein
MGDPAGIDIVDPLITAINKLNMTKEQKDDIREFMKDYAPFPEVLQQLKVAFRAGKLVEFLSGDDETVRVIKDMFRTISAVQKIVRVVDSEHYTTKNARKTIEELGRALTPEEDQRDLPPREDNNDEALGKL